ncbi:COR domain-containing protein [Bacillus thuringiensis]|uniref:COR domain-containing protein n=1 Tax=Bacillus thuringiensis TaxID=1428 RepID=UPI002A69AE12|nr:COR domain-containing protein [Bacillus thuringiensis]
MTRNGNGKAIHERSPRPIGEMLTQDDLLSIIEQAEKESWEILNLIGAGLNELPKEIGRLKSLKKLYLGNIQFIGKDFPYVNKIEKIPDELFELKNLEFLDLYYLGLKELSTKINSLCCLNRLYLTGNEFTIFPTHIFALENLKFLALPNNFKEIPAGISKLVNLRFLSLSFSEITHLPEEIGSLKNLDSLQLTNSKVELLPKSMKNLTNLESIDLKGTCFETFIAPEIIAQTPQEVINFIIRYQEDQNKITLNESKMLIVGQGGVGKSTLLNRLVFDEFKGEGALKSTEGIDIEKWSFVKNYNNYTLNVWDFGGQEIYHSTHQFFLTNRSLYILVWDAQREDEYGRIDYWLNIIESFAGYSPILLVINKCDTRKNIKDIDLKTLRENFPQIIDRYRISCQNGMGIPNLREGIIETTKDLPLMGIVWLSSWVQIRRHLEKLSQSVTLIKYQEYLEICESYSVSQVEAKSLSKYLHDLGIILHFHEDIILQNIVILSPDWGTNAVYKVLDAEDDILSNRNGILYCEDLPNIWTDKENYPEDKYPLILRLMENFQLSFEVEKNKVFLVPELMENQEFEINDIEFNVSNNLTFQYSYDFLPAGIMTRFIVKAHGYLMNKDNKKACWKKGAFLKYKDAVARIQLFDGSSNKRIEINVTGNSLRNKQDLLRHIRLYFDQIHQNINKLKVEERIRCKCNSNCQHLYDHNLLLKYEENAIKDIRCDISLQNTNVFSLLDGIGYHEQENKGDDEFMPNKPFIFNITNTNTNTNTNENVNKINIDIKKVINELQGTISDLRDEIESETPELVKELDKLERGLDKISAAESKEDVIKSGGLRKFNRFMDEVENPDSTLGKTIKSIKGGISIVQDIAEQYNKIAQWCGFPVVPKPFLKNK